MSYMEAMMQDKIEGAQSENEALRDEVYRLRADLENTRAEAVLAVQAAVAAERKQCIAECKAAAEDITDAAKMGALECWRRLALRA